jgi:hypothetical protein
MMAEENDLEIGARLPWGLAQVRFQRKGVPGIDRNGIRAAAATTQMGDYTERFVQLADRLTLPVEARGKSQTGNECEVPAGAPGRSL